MSDLINLKSPEGQKLLEDCQGGINGSMFQPYIHAVFGKQIGKFNCGLQSSAIILSAQQLGKNTPLTSSAILALIPKSRQPITEETMFDYEATRNVLTLEEINQNGGCTLEQMAEILKQHNAEVDTVFAGDVDVNRFRSNAKKALSNVNSDPGVIVNYHMGTLGHIPPLGHHSPVAGYHSATDRLLVMDTGVNEEFWVRTEDLFRAMGVVDSGSNKTRGYCVVKRGIV